MTNTITIKSAVQDLVKNISSTGFFDKIKITATNQQVLIEALEREKEVVFKGEINKPVDNLVGEFGLSNLGLLGHIINDSDFNNADSTLAVNYETRNAQSVPVELAYKNRNSSEIVYRFMSTQLVPPQPKFIEPKWDVTITPSKTSVQQFTWAANGLSSYEQYFIPKVTNQELKFFIGDDTAANQRGAVLFASDTAGKLDGKHKWKISHLLSALKLADNTDCSMSFSNQGVIQVTINTGLGVYKYIFLAKAV